LKKRIRVLVVDDSPLCSAMLGSMLNAAPDLMVIGTASSGAEAIALNDKLRPDLITMDVQMPGLDGFATVQEIMTNRPVPILVVTAEPVHQGRDRTFQALAVGALDLIRKPNNN
jgi:two-component system chemotaxis response regulator CheB